MQAGGTPPMVLGTDEAAALQGPDTMDCIAPGAGLAGALAGRGRRQARWRTVAGGRWPAGSQHAAVASAASVHASAPA